MLGLIPIHDDNPTRRPAVVNWTLIAINVVVFFISPISPIDIGGDANTPQGFCRQLSFFREWAAIPVELLENDPLDVTAGPPSGNRCVPVRPDYQKVPALSVLSAMFLHGGLLHLAGNMLFLFVFGDNIEDALGHGRFLVFYFLCGIAGGAAHAFAAPLSNVPLVGASGAIAGVIAAYMMIRPCARITVLIFGFIPISLASYWVLGFWAISQVWHVFSLDKSDTAWWAHVGGLVAGAVLIVVMRPPGVPLFRCFSPEDAIALAESRSSGPWGRPR